jgi:hypothetical protein
LRRLQIMQERGFSRPELLTGDALLKDLETRWSEELLLLACSTE